MNSHSQRNTPSKLIPAACVIIVTDHGAGPLALLVHRSPELSLQGGLWAFPGGHVDAVDRVPNDNLATARRCAVREIREETGLTVRAEDLIHMARWISPGYLPRRFDTWFFLTVGTYGNVQVDGREIIDHAWYPPKKALLDHNQHQLRLTPPAFVFLSRMIGMDSLDALRQDAQHNGVPYFRGRPIDLPYGRCVLYEGDVAYDRADLGRPGPRNRLWMQKSGWRYENKE